MRMILPNTCAYKKKVATRRWSGQFWEMCGGFFQIWKFQLRCFSDPTRGKREQPIGFLGPIIQPKNQKGLALEFSHYQMFGSAVRVGARDKRGWKAR